jgi:hypothetical protein
MIGADSGGVIQWITRALEVAAVGFVQHGCASPPGRTGWGQTFSGAYRLGAELFDETQASRFQRRTTATSPEADVDP